MSSKQNPNRAAGFAMMAEQNSREMYELYGLGQEIPTEVVVELNRWMTSSCNSVLTPKQRVNFGKLVVSSHIPSRKLLREAIDDLLKKYAKRGGAK
jgi:hypothetical protein